jgi:uncharacterized SAM-binding protein YcdF (DUF218 family)
MINLENDNFFLEQTQEIWDFLCPSVGDSITKVDAIFVFGGLGEEIPIQASHLYHSGVAKKILVTGNSGKFTKDVFNSPEAIVFKDIMKKHNVPDKDIIIEIEATNAGENVAFGYLELKKHLGEINDLVLVSRSYMTRRSIATFRKQHPNINCYPMPPKVNIIDITNTTRDATARRLIAELDRLEDYYKNGFITQVIIPERILIAKQKLSELLGVIEES